MIEIDREKLITEVEDRELEVQLDYSGRRMHGKTCVGVVGSVRDLLTFLLEVVPAIDSYATDGTFREEWLEVHADDMATDMIYYWPGVRAVKNEEDPRKVDGR